MTLDKSDSTGIKDKEYEVFLKTLSLIDLGLTRSSSKFDPVVYVKARSQKTETLTTIVSTSYKFEDSGEQFFESSARFKLRIEGRKTKLRPVTIECAFLAHFHGEPPVNEKLARRFSSSDFRVVVWPYFRQFVQDMTARMSIPPVVIPLSVEGGRDANE